MTILFMDSFDHYTTPTQKWNTAPGTIGAGGRTGNCYITSSGTQNYGPRRSIPSTSTVTVGLAIKIASAGISNRVVGLYEGAGATLHVDLRVATDGCVYAYLNGVWITGTQGTKRIDDNAWHYVEFKAVIADSPGGSVEARVDGVTQFSVSSIDTRNGGNGAIDYVWLATIAGSNVLVNLDDVYITDGAFLGDVKVVSLFPNGAGSSTGFTPSTGSNYTCVDEAAPDVADYVSSKVQGTKDLYTYGDLSNTSGTVHAVQLSTYAAKSDAGSRSIVSVAKVSTNETDSSDKSLSVTPGYSYTVMETKPGGGAWTISDVNSAEFGAKISI